MAAQIALLPYNLIMDPPWEAEYDLGYYRPGDRVPTDITYLPLFGVGPPLRGMNYGNPCNLPTEPRLPLRGGERPALGIQRPSPCGTCRLHGKATGSVAFEAAANPPVFASRRVPI